VKAARPAMFTKSSLMVGLGETLDEVVDAMRALRAVGVDFLTLGQYLQPTPLHLKISEYVTPERFAEYERLGLSLGLHLRRLGPARAL
jgi:lipoic acid synthetase